MELTEALAMLIKHAVPALDDYSILQRIRETDFYYPSPVNLRQRAENSKFILFSAPGAVGKTALAKHIAYTYGGLYWSVSSPIIGKAVFAGVISHAIGIGTGKGALSDEFYNNLKTGQNLLILDAFDEAALTSGRDGVYEFIKEIGNILTTSTVPSIILTARTEMADFIECICAEMNFGITRYDIDYFKEDDAPIFIKKYLQFRNITVTPALQATIDDNITEIRARLDENSDLRSFIGYAQVLIILARQIEKGNTSRIRFPHRTENAPNRLIADIIQQLIYREQCKLEDFKHGIRDKYIRNGLVSLIDSLYNKQEQLLRLQYYITCDGAITLNDYKECSALLQEDQAAYLELLKTWLPEHVFISKQSILPIFGDYMLAESLLNPDLVFFAEEYQQQVSTGCRLPSRVFLDCYLSLNQNCVNCEHIYFLDLAYSSQATINNKTFCEIRASSSEDDVVQAQKTLYLTYSNFEDTTKKYLSIRIIRNENAAVSLNRVENMAISVDGTVELSPMIACNVTIRNADIECDVLSLNGSEVLFETYGDEEIRIIVHQRINRIPGNRITIKGTKRLRISFPKSDGNSRELLYELQSYLYDFESSDSTTDTFVQFVHALKKVLEQFCADHYAGDIAKHKEKIDARNHTGIKCRVLRFLKSYGLIYEEGTLYKCNSTVMDSLRISQPAYCYPNQSGQLTHAYELYLAWLQNNP